MTHPRLIVGWNEWVSLPQLGVPAIKAKIDTGAKTSSIHAYQIEYFNKKGHDFVRFNLHPLKNYPNIVRQCEMPLVHHKIVKSSSGEREERPLIKTQLVIGNYQWDIHLNLTNRDYMGFRMLIGREAMEKLILVQPGAKCIHGQLQMTAAKKLYQ